jgi:hypothetical protein
MDVEIDDRNTPDAMSGARVLSADRNIVEEAKSHRSPRQCVVARRPHGAEDILCFAAEDRIDA